MLKGLFLKSAIHKSLMIVTIFSFLNIAHAQTQRYDLQVMQQFLSSVETLTTELDQSCKAPTNTDLMSSWQPTAQAWFLIQGLALPAVEFMQLDHQVIFWPDPKDRLKNQVRSAISESIDSKDQDTLPASTMSLSAIEYILTLENTNDYCDWLIEIAEKQKNTALQLVNLQKFYEFSTFEQVTALHATALLAHSQLKEALSNPNKVNWYLAPAWRSQTGWLVIQSMSQQIIDLSLALRVESQELIDVQTYLTKVTESSTSFPLDDLNILDEKLVALASYVEQTLAPSLDIYLGFNNFDGD
jgi:predicted lipoprotein